MKSKTLAFITGILLMSFLLISFLLVPASAEAPRYLKLNKVTMELDGTDAKFTLNYELDMVARLYVLFLGSRSIEPAIDEIFYDFDDYLITSVRDNNAVVVAQNISYKGQDRAEEIYFHDSRNFGTQVDTLVIIFPSGASRTFSDVSATPNTFFELK